MKTGRLLKVFFTANIFSLVALASEPAERWSGCQTLVNRLLAKDGRTDLPVQDRKDVVRHLRKKKDRYPLTKIAEKGEVAHRRLMRNRVGEGAFKAPVLVSVIHFPRDLIRRRLQSFFAQRPDPFPYVKKNETPFALIFGKSAVPGRLDAEQVAAVHLDKIKTEIDTTLVTVQNYPKAHQKLIDEAANNVIERAALKRALKFVHFDAEAIPLVLPYFKDGVLQPGVRVEYYPNTVQMRIERHETEMKRIAAELNQLEAEQVANTQKLEMYAHQLRREMSIDPDFDQGSIDAYYKAFLISVDSLHTDGVLNAQYLAPYEAWNSWQWQAFFTQLTKIVWRKRLDLRSMAPDPRVNTSGIELPRPGMIERGLRLMGKSEPGEKERQVLSMRQLFNSISDRDKRALGIGDMVTSFSIFKQTKWMTIFWPAFTAIASGAIYGELDKDDYGQNFFVGLIKATLAEKFKRQECIEAKTETDYKKCIGEYLSIKYPKQYIKDVMRWDELVVSGEVSDPNIRADLETIKSERRVYLYNLATQSMMAKAIDVALDDAGDPSSDIYRRALVKEPNDGVAILKLTSPTPGVGYLATRHPYAYQIPELQALSRLAVENRAEPVAFAAVMAKMREYKFGDKLADDLESVIRDREAYKTAKPFTAEIDKKIEEAIKVSRGIEGEKENNNNLER